MDSFSAYDPRVCFDDLVGDGGAPFYGIVTGARPLDAAQAILHRAHQRRGRPRSHVVGGVADTTTRSFHAEGVTYHVLGADDAPAPDGMPVYGALVKQFSDALPEPKLARVDDAGTYAQFRAARRAPYLANLDARLAALEDAFSQHAADHHAGGQVAALEAALQKHLAECVCGGDAIDLPGPEAESGQIQAWQDGPEILVTICVPCMDGQARFVTSAAPVSSAADEVVGCAAIEGVEPDELLIVAPPVMRLVGAARLVDQMIGAIEEVIDCCGGETGTAVALLPATDPHLAAAMMLLQRCQQGDWSACRDARKLERSHGDFLADAANRLTIAQTMTHGRLS